MAAYAGNNLQYLEAGDDAGFSALMAVYEASFPTEERKSAAWLREMLAEPSYRFLTLGSGAELAGFAVIMRSTAEPITLLEYMAVAPLHRGKGIGRSLFQQVAALTANENRVLVIEIESGESEDQVRRRRFYASLGAEPLAVPYTMPRVAAAPPPPMELLWLSYGRPHPSEETGKRWVTAIHREVYRQA